MSCFRRHELQLLLRTCLLTHTVVYQSKARSCHPDKNPDDPTAHERFQQLGHAYQILSNPQSRAAYDKDGKSSDVEQQMQIDPSVFFNVMFGSTLIEPYVGELWIASTSDSVLKDQDPFEGIDQRPSEELTLEEREERRKQMQERFDKMHEETELKQRLRQVVCAKNLRDKIKDYNPEKPEDFCQNVRAEAVKIAQGPYGALYLMTIGFSLQVAAEEYLGFEQSFLGLGGHLARSRKNAASVGSGFGLIGAGIKAAGAAAKAMKEAEKLQQQAEQEAVEQETMENMAETIDKSLPAFLGMVWAINKRDIQQTLTKVCQKIFDDASVPKEDRAVRAKAIQALGKEFHFVGRTFRKRMSEEFGAEAIKEQMAKATITTMAKAQGQEFDEKDAEEMIRRAQAMVKENEDEDPEAEETTDGPSTSGESTVSESSKEAKTPASQASTGNDSDVHELD